MKYDAVIFDLDGTLLDTIEGLAISMNEARKLCGLEPQPLEKVLSMVGNGMRRLVQRSIAEDEGADEDELLSKFMEYYNAHCVELTSAYAGIPEMVMNLRNKGIKTAVLSNKADYASGLLMNAIMPDMFDDVRGHIEGVPHKPDPTSLNAILERLGVKADRAVYVGDSEVDIETGKNGNMDYISVDWGFKTREFLIEHGARKICSTVSELETELLK